MKSGIFKYVFITFLVIMIVGTIYAIYFRKGEEEDKQIQTNQLEEEQVVEVKELRMGIPNFDTINPLLTKNKEVLNIEKLIFEPLIMIKEDYSMELCLAKECSQISPTSYLIKVDNDVKWQDGTTFTVKDIQFTMDRLKEGKSIYSYNVEKVEGVELIDASTIRINLREEVPFFEYNLTFPILPNNYYINEDFNTSAKTPIGTGMFQIDTIESGEITLSKNERWWQIKEKNSKIEKIHLKLYTEMGELYNAFKLGNIDVFTTSVTDLENYIGTIGYAKTEFKGREFDYLAFNCQNELLKDKNIRKAIEMAIDKNNIVSSIYNNKYDVSNFPLDYGSFLYDAQTRQTNYAQEEAKKRLVDIGWEYTNNTWRKKIDYKTKKLNFTLTVSSSNSSRVAVAENIKNQLAQIGIKITINKVSDAQYKKILENKNYEIILTGVYNSYNPDVSYFFGNNNLENYANEEMNTLLAEVKNVKDNTILKEKYKRIEEIYEEEMPFISLYRNRKSVVKNQSLAGEISGNNYFSYYRIENWYRM